MFSKVKGMFSRTSEPSNAKEKSNASTSSKEQAVTPVSQPFKDKTNESYGIQSLEHARELNLAFISNLLGVRALDSEETQEQELRLRAALDAEIVGMTEKSIPKLSKSALNLMHSLMQDDIDQFKIVNAVNEDPGLAGRVLSIANSPVYVAPGIKIKGIEHALAMLGHMRLRQVVMTSLMADKFKVDNYYFQTFGKSLWEHSTEVAINSRTIAEQKGADVDLAYFAGLVHDIGKLVIFKKLVEIHKNDKEEPHPLVFSRLLNDYSHSLTRRACEVWKLPEFWYAPIIEFQMGEQGELQSPEAVSLFLGNMFAELNTLFTAGEITQFELVWRLQEVGADIEEFKLLYPDTLPVEEVLESEGSD